MSTVCDKIDNSTLFVYKNYINALYIFHNAKVLKILKITTNHH